MFLKRKIILE